MIRNYIKIAWRNLRRHKFFSLVTILSLAIGVTASLVIGLIVYHHNSFDKFHPGGDRIYRITSIYESKSGRTYNPGVGLPLTQVIPELSGVEESVTFCIRWLPNVKTKSSATLPGMQEVVFTDEKYFDMFEYTWLAGSEKTALKNAYEVVLTQSRAEKYFAKLPPYKVLGQTLIYNDSVPVTVVGVVKDFSQPTDFTFGEFISIKTAPIIDNAWNFFSSTWAAARQTQTFIKLTKPEGLPAVKKQLNKIAKLNRDELARPNEERRFELQALHNMHFSKDYGGLIFSGAAADKQELKSLLYIAAFLLLLGCINFINLSTAQATQRAKEIGVRKTMGGSKTQLIIQFLGETLLLTLLACIVSLFLTSWILRGFYGFIPEQLEFYQILDPVFLVYLVLFIMIVSLLSGFYPALVLTRFNPVVVLKNQPGQLTSNTSLRKVLIVSQFAIAQVFVMATFFAAKQISYMINKDMGFKKDAVICLGFPIRSNTVSKNELFAQKLCAVPQVNKLSFGGPPATGSIDHTNPCTYIKGNKQITIEAQYMFADTNYLDLYDIGLLAGRKLRTDTAAELIINETLQKLLGFESPQQAIGKTLMQNYVNYPIVGVMADFNNSSLHTKVKPLVLKGEKRHTPESTYFNWISISLHNNQPELWPQAIAAIKKAYGTIYSPEYFQYYFLDDQIKVLYTNERRMSSLLSWAAGMSILISCLGLLGLVIHTIHKRTKEIGIRKVFGASVIRILQLLCTDFIALVAIAFVIAVPIAWWGVNTWLQDFAYRTTISWWVFALSGLAMLLVALAVIIIRTLQTAWANPVKSLRTE